ncbi:MAG: hypothetical protein WAT39_11420 [Planctomycetota bacterium]
MTPDTDEPDDEIIAEIRRRREAHARSFDFDPKRIVEDLQRQEREAGTPVVTLPPRKPEQLPKQSA